MTPAEARALRKRYDRYSAWVDAGATGRKPRGAPTNREISALEVHDWHETPPARYFAYVKPIGEDDHWHVWRATITTWPGDPIGSARIGRRIRDNFGGYRRHLWINGTNGRTYVGWWFESSGDYCRIRETAASARKAAA